MIHSEKTQCRNPGCPTFRAGSPCTLGPFPHSGRDRKQKHTGDTQGQGTPILPVPPLPKYHMVHGREGNWKQKCDQKHTQSKSSHQARKELIVPRYICGCWQEPGQWGRWQIPPNICTLSHSLLHLQALNHLIAVQNMLLCLK